ncbi:MAG: chemotaxis protein CheB [Desulfobacterium sp.]|nr:chemotaxis protein CheB [Desulfobacterium sp.]
MRNDFQAIVMGVSAGGFNALHTMLPLFPRDFPLPIIIVQHRISENNTFLEESLNRVCQLTVKESNEKETINPGIIYIAPGGYHLLVEKDLTFSLSVDEPVCYSRPSIDVLFETASLAFGPRLIGVILTGANDDGSEGIKKIKSKGGLTIAQDPESAEVEIMPRSAIETKTVDFILPLEEIPSFILTVLEDS